MKKIQVKDSRLPKCKELVEVYEYEAGEKELHINIANEYAYIYSCCVDITKILKKCEVVKIRSVNSRGRIMCVEAKVLREQIRWNVKS